MLKIPTSTLVGIYVAFLRPSLAQANANMSTLNQSHDVPSLNSTSNNEGMFSIAYVTVPSIDVGKSIGHGLVKNKLAACVNIIPQVTSIYEWKNEINEDNEALLMIKTRTTTVDKLTEYVRSVHPYEVCEVISVPIRNGNPPYLQWISDSVPKN